MAQPSRQKSDQPGLYYETHGTQGPYVLLVHGFLSSRAQWLPNLPALTGFCRPVVIELFGHGRSPTPDDPTSYTPRHYVDEFETIRVALGCERWFVCGQSLGAALTLRYAFDRPDRVLAHVFTNSNSALAEREWANLVRPAMEAQARGLEAQGRAALAQHPFNPARARHLPAAVKTALVDDYNLHDVHGVAHTGLYTIPDSSVRERVAENDAPALLVVGEREERFASHRRFAEENMPHLKVLGLDAGHAVKHQAAHEFNVAVEEFLKRFSG